MRASGTDPSLTLVTDRLQVAGGDLLELARTAAAAGIDVIQLREKDLSARALTALAQAVLAATAATAVKVLINGRADVARLVGAAGVQLPEEGLPVDAVKRHFPGLVAGVSCHSIAAVRRAAEAGADFVLMGPIFATPGKEGHVLGLSVLEQAAQAVSIPVHAVGGISVETAPRAVAAGARGLAAIRVFLERPVDEAVAALRAAARRRD